MVRFKKHFNICILAGLICLSPVFANSQVIIALLFGDKLNSDKMEFGLIGGVNVSNISNFPGVSSNTGFNLGLYLNFKLDDKWHFTVEATPKFPSGIKGLKPYSLNNIGLDSLLTGGEVTRKIKNIALPLIVRYNVKNRLFVETGPQINLRTKAKDIFESGDLSYENDIEDSITRFEFGWSIGLSQKIRKKVPSLGLGIRYYFGLTDIDKITAGSQKNGIFQVLLSVPVGTGKNQKTKTETLQ